jgi:hypothetical protein
MAVAREPKKVPGHGKENKHREQILLTFPGAAVELGHVLEEENARHQADVVSSYWFPEPAADAEPSQRHVGNFSAQPWGPSIWIARCARMSPMKKK